MRAEMTEREEPAPEISRGTSRGRQNAQNLVQPEVQVSANIFDPFSQILLEMSITGSEESKSSGVFEKNLVQSDDGCDGREET